MRRRSERSRGSAASLACDGDEHIYMREIRTILESPPVVGPPRTVDQLNGHVFIGCQRNADDVATLRRLGITHVLHCAAPSSRVRSPYGRESGVDAFLALPAEDQTDYDITQHFAEAFAFLDKAKRRGGRALVHCNLGINRSGAVCAAYLMVDQRTNLLDVVRLLKAKRSVVLWNRGFRLQLVRFARSRRLLGPLPSTAAARRSCSSDTLKATPPAERRSGRSVSPGRRGGRRGSREEEEESSGALTASLRRSFRSRLATSLLARHAPEEDNKSLKAFLTIPRSRKNSSCLKENNKPEQQRYGASTSDTCVGRDTNGLLPALRHAHSSSDCASGMRSRQASLSAGSRVVTVRATDEEDTSLSTARPLRVYKKAATDTLIYMRSKAASESGPYRAGGSTEVAYRDAATNDKACGQRATDNGIGRKRENGRGEERYGSVNILSRMRPTLSRRSSRTSVNT